jgi:hypothetical protein
MLHTGSEKTTVNNNLIYLKARLFISDQWEFCVRFVCINPIFIDFCLWLGIEPDMQAKMRPTLLFYSV